MVTSKPTAADNTADDSLVVNLQVPESEAEFRAESLSVESQAAENSSGNSLASTSSLGGDGDTQFSSSAPSNIGPSRIGPPQVGRNEFDAMAHTVLQQQKWRNISNSGGGSIWWRQLGLRSKVTAAAIALSLLPAITIGGIAFVNAGSTVEAQIKTAKKNSAVALTRRLQIYMGFRLADIQDLTTRLIFRDPLVVERVGEAEISRRLNEYLARYKVYDSLAFFDLDGNMVVQSDGPKLPNIKSETYFQTAITSGERTYSNPQRNDEIEEPAVFIAAPIRSVSDLQIIGIVRLRLPLSSLYNAVADIQTDIDDIYVTDDQGNYILTPPDQTDLIGQPLSSDFSDLWSTISQVPLQASRVRDEANEKWLVASSQPITESKLFNPQWTGLIKTSTADAFQVEYRLFLTLILGTAATALISLALALYLSKRSVQSLLEAATALKKIGQGDLDTRLQVPEQGDELVQLSQNINLMGGQLQTFFENQTLEAQLAKTLGDLARAREEEELTVLLDQVMHEIQRQMGVDRVTFQRVEQVDGSGTILAEAVMPNLPRAQGRGLASLSVADQETYSNQQSLILNQIDQSELATERFNQLHEWDVKSMISTPVFLNHELYGLLAVHSCQQERQWDPSESDFLTSIGSRLGLALGGFESYRQAQIRAQEERQAKENLQAELVEFISSVEGASSGDLTVRAQITAGEIGIVADFFNAIVENLRDVVTEVKQATTQVNSSVSLSGESIGQLANETLNQSHQVKETLVSVETMTQSLQDVATKAQEASKTTQQAELTAQAGGQAMEKTVDSIQQVRETVAETAKKVKRLGESSQQISKVIELINQIALKTNLLAVNAGIEAARAGEEGRGFAVVAEEVGTLAAQSASATKEIEQIIHSIQTGTSEVVEAMENSTAQVVEGTRSVTEAQNSLSEILVASQQVNEIFQMISKETVEQADTSSLVQQLMNQMAKVSESASEDSETVAKLLDDTNQVAKQLQETVSTFKVD